MLLKSGSTALLLMALLAAPAMALAGGNANQEISTAATHAAMAGNAADTATAIMHFHHVINCLVGPKNRMFDAAVGNPCQDMGNGAMNDVGKKSPQYTQLQQVLAMAERAVHAKNLSESQQYAAHISQMLMKVKAGG
ncbi:MAG: hypothetical protein KGL13_09905 [Gammaproteobacteria bacterium]|nr:hypothetical protein [Gammaproteobacteria bacterium]MDE2346766.1 hypothetical protein [Gammaproteobacteria bacterium]